MSELHLDLPRLEAGLAAIRLSPADEGRLEMIVRRPAEERREILDEATLDLDLGLVGDNWKTRGSRRMPGGVANPDAQITIMNARLAALVAGERERWALAGDQLYLDLDLSATNLPPGTRLSIGTAVVEITAVPHTGCGKFTSRFGIEAMKFVNSPLGRDMQLRGVNAKVVVPGTVRVGDVARKR